MFFKNYLKTRFLSHLKKKKLFFNDCGVVEFLFVTQIILLMGIKLPDDYSFVVDSRQRCGTTTRSCRRQAQRKDDRRR